MREKIYEFRIDHPLTAAKRKAIDQYVVSNAHLAPTNVSHTWDGRKHAILHLSTPPIKWEIAFHPKVVEIQAVAPLWAYLLFNDEKRQKLKQQIELMLRNTGFLQDKRKVSRSQKPSKVRVNRNGAR